MAYVPKACGFVLFRDGPDHLETLLLMGRKHGSPGVPKGHVEPGETELETAIRETREETGLTRITPDPFFRTELRYPARRKGRVWNKTVVLFLARTGRERVVLSKEHAAYAWLGLADALDRVPFENLRRAIRDAALYVKDPALFDLEPATEVQAVQHLETLEYTDLRLLAHLQGTARLARAFARALAEAGKPVNEEATAVGAWLHDVGRALGCHEDHQLAGVEHLAGTELEAYRFASEYEEVSTGIQETVQRMRETEPDRRIGIIRTLGDDLDVPETVVDFVQEALADADVKRVFVAPLLPASPLPPRPE